MPLPHFYYYNNNYYNTENFTTENSMIETFVNYDQPLNRYLGYITFLS